MNLDAIGKILLADWINKLILLTSGVFASLGIHFDDNAGMLIAAVLIAGVHMVINHITVRKALNTPTLSPNATRAATLFLLLGFVTFTLAACAQWTQYEPDVVDALSALQQAAAQAQASGAIPAGKATNAVSDTETTTSALETLVTGQPITPAQTSALVSSWKLDSTSATYASLGVTVIDGLVGLTQTLIAEGESTSAVKQGQVNYLTNAPLTVQTALAPTATATASTNP